MINPEAPAKAPVVIRSIVVPAALYHAATVANLNLMDLTVFGKLRKIASLEDIAGYAALNDLLMVNNTKVATSNLVDVVTLGEGNAAEFQAVFGYMKNSEEIFRLAVSYIEPVSDPFKDMLALGQNRALAVPVPNRSMRNTLGAVLTDEQDSTYQLKTSGSNVFVVTGNGFNKYVGASSESGCPDSFVKAFLQHCSGLYSPPEVARHPLFKTFLHSLAV